MINSTTTTANTTTNQSDSDSEVSLSTLQSDHDKRLEEGNFASKQQNNSRSCFGVGSLIEVLTFACTYFCAAFVVVCCSTRDCVYQFKRNPLCLIVQGKQERARKAPGRVRRVYQGLDCAPLVGKYQPHHCDVCRRMEISIGQANLSFLSIQNKDICKSQL